MASKKNILLLLAVVLIVIQFFPIDTKNPESDPSQDYLSLVKAPTQMSQLIKDACYDCHSHHTVYPWYTRVQPIGWWLRGHVNHGSEHLNFSEWGSYSEKKANHKLEECVEMMEAGSMPLKSYTWAHPEAQLTDGQKQEMINWFKGN